MQRLLRLRLWPRMPRSSPSVRMANCGRCARVRAHLLAFPMIQTLRETTRCAWTENGLEWFKALLAHEKPPEGKIWFAYMLKGGSDASNDDPFASEPATGKKWVQTGPHVMVGGPGITKMLDSYSASADDTRRPYIMFGGTPYEHVMLPVQ